MDCRSMRVDAGLPVQASCRAVGHCVQQIDMLNETSQAHHGMNDFHLSRHEDNVPLPSKAKFLYDAVVSSGL